MMMKRTNLKFNNTTYDSDNFRILNEYIFEFKIPEFLIENHPFKTDDDLIDLLMDDFKCTLIQYLDENRREK